MVWVVCVQRFIAQEGNIKAGQRLDVRCQRRLDYLKLHGYVVEEPQATTLPLGSWAGETVAIFAGGPSLTAEDINACIAAGVRRIAVNDAYRLDPLADMLYACDLKWWKVHHEAVDATFAGIKATRDSEAAQKYHLSHIASENAPGLSRVRGVIHEGGNSGYQALNIAYQMGAASVILLGFDMGADGKGRTHWFGKHPAGLEVASPYAVWVEKFWALADDLKAEGVEVLNCSRKTALACFPCESLARALT